MGRASWRAIRFRGAPWLTIASGRGARGDRKKQQANNQKTKSTPGRQHDEIEEGNDEGSN